jgi:acetyl-CoA carboxylase biotin carboxyl carrier protein
MDLTPDDTPAQADDTQAVLAAVQDSALKLLADAPRLPATLRIQAGDVSIEVAWATPAAPGAPNGGAAGPPVMHLVPSAAETTSDSGTAGPGAGSDETDDRRYLCAPTVGSFYRSPEPGAPPFVEVGDTVNAGQQVAIVETMKLMIPVKAELSGTVVEVLKNDGDSVEHGERLFVLVNQSE